MAGPLNIPRRAISETSQTLSDMGAALGELRFEGGNVYKMMRATATLSVGAQVQLHSASDATDGGTVNVMNLTNVPANGVYNAQTVTLAASAFFWGQVAGVGPVLCGATSLASNVAARASSAGLVAAVASNGALNFRTIGSIAVTVTGQAHINCGW